MSTAAAGPARPAAGSTEAGKSAEDKRPVKGSGAVTWLDERLGLGGALKKQLRKVFPDHWSFMLGEIALWSFVILLLTGVFLTLWFKPSMNEVTYMGSYPNLRGVTMSEAYSSTLALSFDIRGGLLMRQMHHWAANLFLASMTIHMLRVFFTGAFRKPRELNWLVGLAMLQLGIIEGFAGYSLPDDLLSGVGLRIAEGLMLSIPVVGTYVAFFVFGGEFPGDILIPRLYTVHVLLIPGILLGLVAAHMLLLVYHKHTQWPGPGRTNNNVVGYPLMPVYMAKAGGYFFIVFGVTGLMGALMQINPVWMYGPYDPSQVSAGSQPDWYMGWLDGGLRLMPNWEIEALGYTLSVNVFVPGVLLMGILFTVLGAYPFIEQWVTGDKREHHLLERPRNAPTRTAFGVAGMTAYGLLWIGGGNDVMAVIFRMSLESITWVLRFALFLGPILAFIITKRLCISLQRHDRDTVLHGYETGVIVRSPSGAYSEIHAPINPERAYTLTAHERPSTLELPVAEDSNGVAAPGRGTGAIRARLSRFWFADDLQKPTVEELHEAAHHAHDDDTAISSNGHQVGIGTGGQVGGDHLDLEQTGKRST
ncbi:MAG TPA: cytochrome bc complex cytochrome b subunit [Nocardioidaceae bacterium]|nr:cytochrome bc complex cytochrome b subunit [Nocardioidaceae bacterium]